MTEYTTIRVSKAAKESAQEAKREAETWNDYLQRCTDTPPNITEFVEKDRDEPTEPVPIEEVVGREVLIDELSNIEAAVKENTNKVEETKSLVEDLGGKR